MSFYSHATQPSLHRQAVVSFETNSPDESVKGVVLSAHRKPLPLAPSLRARYNPSVPPVSQSIRVKVLFFGRLKDLIGKAEDSVDSADASTIEQLFALYAARNPELAKYRPSLVASRNQEFAAWDTPLHSGDEVAFLPPVSGG
jgi:molybdopterin synthase sulfur carrier subunit